MAADIDVGRREVGALGRQCPFEGLGGRVRDWGARRIRGRPVEAGVGQRGAVGGGHAAGGGRDHAGRDACPSLTGRVPTAGHPGARFGEAEMHVPGPTVEPGGRPQCGEHPGGTDGVHFD